MYRIIYYNNDNALWDFESKYFDTAHEAHNFALDNYFDYAFHIVKICMIAE